MNIAELFASLTISPNQKSFDAADKLIGHVKTALIGLGAVAGAHALIGLVDDTIALGSHINDLSQSVGVSTDTLQILGHAAKLNSSDMDEMGHTLGKLQKNMAAAAKDGTDPAAEAFQKLGVRVTDATGHLRPVEDVFEDISINQRKMTNEGERNASLFQVMSRGALALVPTMNDVADKGMKHFADEARELGAVIDADTIPKLDEMGDTQDKIKESLVGLRNQAVIALLPQLQSMADGMLKWITANRKMITMRLQQVFEGLSKALQFVGTVINKYVIPAFSFISKHADFFKIVLGSLVVALGVFKIASIGAAVASGIAWALANIPLLLLMALIAAVVLIVEDLYTAFDGGNSIFKDWLGQERIDQIKHAFETIKAAAQTAFNWIRGGIESMIARIKFFVDMAEGAIKTFASIVGGSDKGNSLIFGTPEKAGASDLSQADTVAAFTRRATTLPGQAALTSGATTSVQAPVSIQINGTHLSAEELSKSIGNAMADFWAGQMRNTAAGVGVK